MEETLTIDSRFCGPPGTGNGGYCCGLLAGAIGGTIRTTLRKPVPLERALRVERADGDLARLLDGNTLVAEAEPAELDLKIPAPPALALAQEAAKHYPGFRVHTYPGCFVCGPQHATGLRIFTGPVASGGMVAAPWTPDASLADAEGRVRPELLWAALDCPGYWGAIPGDELRPALLGQMTARIDGSVRAGEPCIVIGWPVVSSGRKHRAGTALFTAAGELRGAALTTWIELRAELPG